MIDWSVVEDLFTGGIPTERNKVLRYLMIGSYLPEPVFNAISIYNLDDDVIATAEDWKMLVSVLEKVSPKYNSYWNTGKEKKNYQPAMEFAKRHLIGRPYALNIFREWKKAGANNYLKIFPFNYRPKYLHEHLETISQVKEEDLDIIEDYFESYSYVIYINSVIGKIPLDKRERFLLKIAKNTADFGILQAIMPHLNINTIEEWREIFENKPHLIGACVGFISTKPYYHQILNDCLTEVNKSTSVSKKDAYMVCTTIMSVLQHGKSVTPQVYEAAKKIRTNVNVDSNVAMLKEFKKFDGKSPEFEEYMKDYIANETRVGILKNLAKILPKKQLPWLLSSKSKTVKKAVKKRLA